MEVTDPEKIILHYEVGDEMFNKTILDQIIPTRDTLVCVYKYFNKFSQKQKFKYEQVIEELYQQFGCKINLQLLKYALDIFKEGNLIVYKWWDELFELEVNKTAGKINIEQLTSFQEIQYLYRHFEYIINN